MYGPAEFFGRLFEMCKNREYAERCAMSSSVTAAAHSSATGDEKKTPTAQWILGKMKAVRRDYMLKRCCPPSPSPLLPSRPWPPLPPSSFSSGEGDVVDDDMLANASLFHF